MSNVPRIVYHYCSIDSFMSIVKNRTLRLTNIVKSNDYQEIRYCIDGYASALQSACKKLKDRFNIHNIADFYDMTESALVSSFLVFYAACFSAESDLLSQWRGYADDGKGIAIGFDAAFLQVIKKSQSKLLIR